MSLNEDDDTAAGEPAGVTLSAIANKLAAETPMYRNGLEGFVSAYASSVGDSLQGISQPTLVMPNIAGLSAAIEALSLSKPLMPEATLAAMTSGIARALDGMPTMAKLVEDLNRNNLATLGPLLNTSEALHKMVLASQEQLGAKLLPGIRTLDRLHTINDFIRGLDVDEDEINAEIHGVVDAEAVVAESETDLAKVIDLQDPKVRRNIVRAVQFAVWLAIAGTLAGSPMLLTLAKDLFVILGFSTKIIADLMGKAAKAGLDWCAPVQEELAED